MLNTLYEKTKGYKTLVGILVTFVAYGLAGIKAISPEQAKQLESLGAYIIAFGLGDKVATKINQ